MKKKDLLAMKKLQATRLMLDTAKDNPIVAKQIRSSWGNYYRQDSCRYSRYFRASVQNGVLKVAVFIQNDLQAGNKDPKYEIYCDKENNAYITYENETDKWRTSKIDNLSYGMSYLYESRNWQQDTDRKMVNDYFGTGKNKEIYTAVLDFQAEIKSDQLTKKHRKELDQIDETMREVPDIPKNFREWIAKNCFRETMFYEPDSQCRNRWPKMYCTHCRQWMDTQSWPNKPEHNKEDRCPKCGVNITYKSWNRQQYVIDETDVGLLQRLKDDTGWIARSFHCRIRRRHETGWSEYELSVYEDTRARLDDYFVEREMFEYGEYKTTGVTRWCHECRKSQWGYYYPRELGRVVMYTPNLKRELKKEQFGNMDFKKIMCGGKRERVSPVYILQKLRQHPYVEYLQKSGLTTLTDEIMNNCEERELFADNELRLHDVLKLDKQRYQRFKQLNGGSRTLRALQYEIATGYRVTDDNIRFMEEKKADVKELIVLTERTGMNLQRTCNYLHKQMDITGQNFRDLCRHYTDYIDMAEMFGMDITDEIVCRQPRMMEFHDRYTARKNRQKNKSRDAEVDLKYPKIRENEQKFKERFAFSTKEFQIVVPHTASDITKEGRKQHHCVGATDNYISNMNKERYFILFLRRKENLKKPYYTLEVTWDGEIKQFYAAYDRQPDKEKIRAVLDEFTKRVQKRELELQKKLHECEERDGLKAVRIGTQWEMYKAEVV